MKKIAKLLLLSLTSLGIILSITPSCFADPLPPDFEHYFAKKITDEGSEERVFNISCISKNNRLQTNINCLFSPYTQGGGVLRNVVKYWGIAIVFFYLVFTGIKLLLNLGKGEEIKSGLINLLYVLLGSLLFFGAVWIFSDLLNLNSLTGTGNLKDNLIDSGGILYFALSLLKGAAFFIAIISIGILGFRIMNPKAGESGDSKKIAKGLINVIFALIGMKVVDFIYYIASLSDFASKAGNFILEIIKFLAYIAGSVIVFMIIYAGYQLVVDGGQGENFKKAKNILINIVLAVVALFFFLFILYQVFSDLAV